MTVIHLENGVDAIPKILHIKYTAGNGQHSTRL